MGRRWRGAIRSAWGRRAHSKLARLARKKNGVMNAFRRRLLTTALDLKGGMKLPDSGVPRTRPGCGRGEEEYIAQRGGERYHELITPEKSERTKEKKQKLSSHALHMVLGEKDCQRFNQKTPPIPAEKGSPKAFSRLRWREADPKGHDNPQEGKFFLVYIKKGSPPACIMASEQGKVLQLRAGRPGSKKIVNRRRSEHNEKNTGKSLPTNEQNSKTPALLRKGP